MNNTAWNSLPSGTELEFSNARQLLTEYTTSGYIRRTPTELLNLPDGTIIEFYKLLSKLRNAYSPVEKEKSSDWMLRTDFCFINVRATGINDKFGNFIQASKLLPGLRVGSIHLAPFLLYDFQTIYAVSSLRMIDDRLLHPGISLSASEQLTAFVQAAHLLNKTVGFDIEPHTAQFSIAGIMNPESFRWIKLNPEKSGLANGITNREMLREEYQRSITSEINELVAKYLKLNKINTLEAEIGDNNEELTTKRNIFRQLIGVLINGGYWPIPSQSWAGEGVPEFKEYNREGNFPMFNYLGKKNEDLSGTAYHITSPYKFYENIPSNSAPHDAKLHESSVKLFCDIFPFWRDNFGFDFVRYDSVDHIFDSEKEGLPLSDRPTSHVLRLCVEASREPGKRYIGNFAERMGNEITEYAGIGFDLMLGNDMLQWVNNDLLIKSFELFRQLDEHNMQGGSRFGITFAVDTHDTGNPAFWNEPLVSKAGPNQMRLRHYLSRFLSVSTAPRPKYEAMGSQDLSFGLYDSNVTDKNLIWNNNREYNFSYHFLEDVYSEVKDRFYHGTMLKYHTDEFAAHWIVRNGNTLFIALICFSDFMPHYSLHLDQINGLNIPCIAEQYNFGLMNKSSFEITSLTFDLHNIKNEEPLLLVVNAGR